MAWLIKKDDSKPITVRVIDAEAAPVAGLSLTSSWKWTKSGGAIGNAAGTLTDRTLGVYEYTPTAGEVDTLGNAQLSFHDTTNGYVSVGGGVQVVAFDPRAALSNQTIARSVTGFKNVYYVSTAGNDSNDGLSPATAKLTPSAALALATAGDAVFVGAGDFNVGTGVTVPAGVTMRGVSAGATRLYSSTADLDSNQGIVITSEGVTIEDLFIEGTNTGGMFQVPLMIRAASNDTINIRRVSTYAYTDGIYTDATTNTIANCYDCSFRSKYDAVRLMGIWDYHVEINLYNCNCRVDGPFASIENCARAIGADSPTDNAGRATIRVFGGIAEAYNGGAGYTSAIATTGTPDTGGPGANIYAYGVAVRASSTNGPVQIIKNSDAANTIEVTSVAYTAADTSGTITTRSFVRTETATELGQITTTNTNVGTLLSRIGAFTGSGVNTILGFLKAIMSKAASTPSDVGGTFDASTDSTEAIRDRGDAAWTGNGGTFNGANAVTVNVKYLTTNISGATVSITQGIIVDTKTTDASGNASFSLDNGSYTLAIVKSGYSFTPETITISAAATLNKTVTAISSPAPAQPDVCRVYDTAKNASGAAASGVVYKWRIIDGEARVYPGNTYTATSSGTGENNIYFDVARGAKVAVKRGAGLRGREDRGEIIIDVPATSTAQLEDLIERAVVGLDE